MPLPYVIEGIPHNEEALIREIVYQAIFVADGETAPTREILERPALQKYHTHWGRPGDIGLMAVEKRTERAIGGAFVRLYPAENAGYGFVAEDYPELNISVWPGYRGHGIGTQLLEKLIVELKKRGFPGLSLSVDARNPALTLYLRQGFKVVKEEGNPSMLLRF